MADHLMSQEAAQLVRELRPRLPHPARLLPWLRQLDPSSKWLERDIWRHFKAQGGHVSEDSDLVKHTAALVRSGSFGAEPPADD